MSKRKAQIASVFQAGGSGDYYRRLSIAYALGVAPETLTAQVAAAAKEAELRTRQTRAERLAARAARKRALKAARKSQHDQRSKSRRQRGREYTTNYLQYIQSNVWLQFRASIFAERGRKCEQCQRTDGVMHLHHLTYKNLGHEKPRDVKILCYDCHEQINGKLTVAARGQGQL